MTQETDWTAVSDAAHRDWVDSQKPQTIQQDGPIGPRECPITGRAFYDNMEHPDLGWIAMYGGPLDVYSIPRLEATDNELRVERYDLDADGWVEGGETLGYFYRDQQPRHMHVTESMVHSARYAFNMAHNTDKDQMRCALEAAMGADA